MKTTYERIQLESVEELVSYIKELEPPFYVRVEKDENEKRIEAEFRAEQ